LRRLIVPGFLLAFSPIVVSAQQYDLVLEGGRVMDPETGLDAVRNVGIRDGKIVRISSETLSEDRIVHSSGLVVAPGFIDLHQHSQDLVSERVKALDGVTTALELELGAPDVAQFLRAKEGHSLIHYVTSASHLRRDRSHSALHCRPETSYPRVDPRPISPPLPNKSRTCGIVCGLNWTLAAWPLAWVSSTRREQLGLR
jgi:hypothetical protein